ncbi:hypothetical protein Glove_217g138 [Diversispora epigaea]|uniref:Uncharacterized protein n=1 Tax=Diversispora epigaea TaxID=1348612 RepID=A0A397IQU3_9GLOM|nr:hypothetical protein Glove_217g138 [Diversispora epigaea]
MVSTGIAAQSIDRKPIHSTLKISDGSIFADGQTYIALSISIEITSFNEMSIKDAKVIAEYNNGIIEFNRRID